MEEPGNTDLSTRQTNGILEPRVVGRQQAEAENPGIGFLSPNSVPLCLLASKIYSTLVRHLKSMSTLTQHRGV